MKKAFHCIALMVTIVLMLSCKKKDATTVTPSAASTSYFPTTTGSYWQYTVDYLYVTGNTNVVNGKTYYQIRNTTAPSLSYMAAANGTYYLLEDNSFESRLYHDGANVGDSWIDTVQVNNIGVHYGGHVTSTVKETNLTVPLHGITYKNVIHIDRNYYYPDLSQRDWYVIYAAPGIGIIEQIHSSTSANTVDDQLVKYSIK